MKSKPDDAIVGLAVVAVAALLVWYALGLKILLWVFGLFLFGTVVLHLWSSKSIALRFLAVVLMPAVLLIYLIPKKSKHGVQSGDAPDVGENQ